MKTVIAPIVAAVAASACCLGPVVFSLMGAGALGAAAVALEPLRPLLLVVTGALLAISFYLVFRGASGVSCSVDGNCRPGASRTTRMLLWIATVVIVLIVTFPYYMNWFV
jgi:mercuric ion transport protein